MAVAGVNAFAGAPLGYAEVDADFGIDFDGDGRRGRNNDGSGTEMALAVLVLGALGTLIALRAGGFRALIAG